MYLSGTCKNDNIYGRFWQLVLQLLMNVMDMFDTQMDLLPI